MRIFFVAFCCLLGWTPLAGQSPSEESWEFYDEISELANGPRPRPCETIRLDSLDNQLFEAGKAQMTLPPKGRWQILFEHHTDWEHYVGDPTPSNNIETILRKAFPTVPMSCAYSPALHYSSKELIAGLELEKYTANFLTDSLTRFPSIRERADPLNGIWTVFLSGDFLILRHVISYPDGNMRSYYEERRLYFRRVY